MKQRRLIYFVLMFLLLAAGCGVITGPDSSAPEGSTGIEGQVLIGPTHPVQQPGETPDYAPFEATIEILNGSAQRVAVQQSAEDGTFRMQLPPGRYTLVPESFTASTGNVEAPGYPHADKQAVTVVEGRYTEVRVVYDSGIR